MPFYAFLHQTGGCDYTIGCGNLLVTLNAGDRESAIKELKETILSNYTGDRQLESALLIEGTSQCVDIYSWYSEYESQKIAAKKREKEENEKQLYEVLKKKYGD